MSVDPVRLGIETADLSKRFVASTTVVASPATNAETIIASITISEPEAIAAGILLSGWAAFTVGTSGTAIRMRIRRTNVAGTVVADSGALTGGVAAAALMAQDVEGVDVPSASQGDVYVLTLQVTGGAAASTVSAVALKAIVD